MPQYIFIVHVFFFFLWLYNLHIYPSGWLVKVLEAHLQHWPGSPVELHSTVWCLYYYSASGQTNFVFTISTPSERYGTSAHYYQCVNFFFY